MELSQLIQKVREAKSNDWAALISCLRNSEHTVEKRVQDLNGVLSAELSPSTHSLGFVFFLSIQASNEILPKKKKDSTQVECPTLEIAKSDGRSVFSRNAKALLTYGVPEQLCHAKPELSIVVRAFAMCCGSSSKYALGALVPLRRASQILSENHCHINAAHAGGLLCSLAAKNYKFGQKHFLESVDVFSMNKSSGLCVQDLLLFSYYGGMLWIGQKQYKKALNTFLLAFALQTSSLSLIMIEAFKKYTLVHLLVHGTMPKFPGFCHSSMTWKIKDHCKVYTEFAQAYVSGNTKVLHQVAMENSASFASDKNFGLVKQCIGALFNANIKRYAQAFITVSLNQINQETGPEGPTIDTEKRALRMIEDGQMFAKINQKEGMLTFLDNSEAFDSAETLGLMHNKISRTMTLCSHIRETDEKISKSENYLRQHILPYANNALLLDEGDSGIPIEPIGLTDEFEISSFVHAATSLMDP